MSFLGTAKAAARIIRGLSPIVIDAARATRTWKKKGDPSTEDLSSQVARLEKELELQSHLNEQYRDELHLLKAVLEGTQRSIRLVFSLALLACLLASAALVLLFLK
jgi:hypothetical protein